MRRSCVALIDVVGAGTSAKVYAERRAALCRTLPPHSVLIVPAGDEVALTNDVFYPFHQDAVFFHLFGLHTPLRRSLQPPTAVATEDIHATMAAFLKSADGTCKALLFLPIPTEDMASAVWATAPDVTETVKRTLQGVAPHGVPVHVLGNRVDEIATTLHNEIAHLVVGAASADENGIASPSDLPDTLSRWKRSLPTLHVAVPSQIRVHSERYRMLRPERVEAGAAAVGFLHPLEALFAHLLATPFALPAVGGSTSDAHGVCLTYALPTRAGAPVGESFPLLTPPRETVDTLRQWHAATPTTAATNDNNNNNNSVGTADSTRVVPSIIRSARDMLWRYRLRKAPSQLAQHLLSARVTRDAFLAAMRAAAMTTSEFDIHCAFDQSLMRSRQRLGADADVRSAYVPVVAAGAHAAEIHYVENNGVGAPGDLVRLDAGAMVCHVPTDCTRTFPLARPGFDRASLKAEAYTSLLALQRRLVKAVAPGVSPVDVARSHVCWTRDHLEVLGVGKRAESGRVLDVPLIHNVFCAHGYGHFFGLDLHEKYVSEPVLTRVAAESRGSQDGEVSSSQAKPKLSYAPMRFDGGMMHTVEPGFYFPSEAQANACHYDPRAISLVPPDLQGCGVQIEDDVFVLPAKKTSLESGEPTRVDFLAAAIAVQRDLVRWDLGTWPSRSGTAPVTQNAVLPRCCLLSHAPAAASAGLHDTASLAFAATSFLFEQRACMDSVAHALDALDADAAACLAGFELAEDEALAHFANHCYPYDVIVTTACVPKEMDDIDLIRATC